MNNKLNREIMSITDLDENNQTQKRIAWLNAYKDRREFIDNLNEDIANKGLVGKEKSKYYSDSMVNYDSNNMRIW